LVQQLIKPSKRDKIESVEKAVNRLDCADYKNRLHRCADGINWRKNMKVNGSTSLKIGILCLMILSQAFFSGCATIGRDFAAAEVPKIQNGKTTQSEIMSIFGSPWRTGMEDGKQTWTYGKYHYSLFEDASARDLVVRFDSRGIVSSYTYNTTEQPQ
jgi:hypothetical protein